MPAGAPRGGVVTKFRFGGYLSDTGSLTRNVISHNMTCLKNIRKIQKPATPNRGIELY